jgi:hypothetical protein
MKDKHVQINAIDDKNKTAIFFNVSCCIWSSFFFYREFIERTGAHVTTVQKALWDSDLVIIAVPKDYYKVQSNLFRD